VAPLKLARGLQNKVLEGMAMARPVVSTSAAVRALDVSSGKELWIADEPEAFAQAVIGALEARTRVAAHARRYVEHNHDWNRNLRAFDRLLMAGPLGKASRVLIGHPPLPLARAAQ
jgi:glycosyltransferase involved in cell wall biosynthesis